MGKIKNKSYKIKRNNGVELEIVPQEKAEAEPLPEARSSDDTIPKKVR